MKKLTEGSVAKTLIKISLPMMGGLFSILSFNLVDNYFVGKLGHTELAAMSLIFPIVMIFITIALGLAVGATSVISRAIGEGNQDKVRRLTTDSLTLSFLIVCVALIIGYSSLDTVFIFMGADDKLLPLIREYMEIWYAGMLFVIIPMVGNGAIRATGDTHIAAAIMIIAAITNAILDPMFIFGIGFIPAFGIRGAAIATTISKAITLIASVIVLHRKYHMLTIQFSTLKKTIESWKRIAHIAFPAALTNVLTPLSMGVITSIVARYGHEAVAAFGVSGRIQSFSLILLMGVSMGLAPFVGQNTGAHKEERVKQAITFSFLFAVLWGVVVAGILFFYGRFFTSLFSSNPLVLKIGELYFLILPISYGMEGIRMMSSSAFNARGYPLIPTTLTIVKMFGLYIPLVLLGSHLMQVRGIFFALTTTNIIIGIASYYFVRSKILSNQKRLP